MGAGNYSLTDAVPLLVSYGKGAFCAVPGAGLSYEQAGAFKRLNAPAEKIMETTAAMRELAERRYTV